MSDVLDLLKDAKALIEDEKNWTQRALARNSNGDEVHTYDKEAVCFCAVGSLYISSEQLYRPAWEIPLADSAYNKARSVLDKVSSELYEESIVRVNDDMGHFHVMRVFNTAIKELENE